MPSTPSRCLSQGWSLDSRHRPAEHQTPTAMFESLCSSSPKHTRTYLQAFTPTDFYDAPFTAVETLLTFNALSLCEDDLLHAVLNYVCRRANITGTPKAWTAEQRNKVLPQLATLLPSIRFLSLTTHTFLHVVEPLALLPDDQLIDKYRFDALHRIHTPHICFHALSKWYPDQHALRKTLSTLRGRSTIVESSHPHPTNGSETTHITTSPWAPRMLIEFDRRTHIASQASLTLFADRREVHPVAEWHAMWHRRGERRSVKSLVFEGAHLYLRLDCGQGAQPAWGWKLMAIPLVRDDDFNGTEVNADAACDCSE